MTFIDRIIVAITTLTDAYHSLNSHSIAEATLFFAIGALVGSFVNVVVCRLPKIIREEALLETLDWYPEVFLSKENTYQLIDGENLIHASTTPCCGTKIRWYQNIPLISYIALKGRCHTCKHPIAKQYAVIELVTALIFALTTYIADSTAQAWWLSSVLTILLTIAVIDIKHHLIPNTLPLLLLVLMLMQADSITLSMIMPGMIAYAILTTINHYHLTKKGFYAIGGGDIKLIAALAIGIGIQAAMLVLLTSLVAFTLWHKFRNSNGEEALGHYIALFSGATFLLKII